MTTANSSRLLHHQSQSRPSWSLWMLGCFLFYAGYVNTNDPDAYFWTPAYGIGGILSWICFYRPNTVQQLRHVYRFYWILSLATALFSFSLLLSGDEVQRISGKSGWLLGVLELEPVREGVGSLLMALAMYLCLEVASSLSLLSSSCHKQDHNKHVPSASTISGDVPILVTTLSGIVAAAAIFMGVILPQYYTRIGVPIAEHCGGNSGVGGPDSSEINLDMSSQ